MPLVVTQRSGLVDLVIEQMRQAISSGEWPVGQRIRDTAAAGHNWDLMIDRDTEFHVLIVRTSHNALLTELCTGLTERSGAPERERVVSAFVTTLRTQVDLAQQALKQARQAGDNHQVHRHSARLLDLLERAASHGVDTSDWVSPEVVLVASAAAGNGS